MMLRFLGGLLCLLPFTTAAQSQVMAGGLVVDCTQIATTYRTGLNRCTGQLETRRCCIFQWKVTNTTLTPVSTFWLEVSAGDGAVICYDHGAPFGTGDISLPGFLPTMCYGYDCAAYTSPGRSNRGVIRFNGLVTIPPGATLTGKFTVDTSRVNASTVTHPVPRGCVHVHATVNSPTSLGASCGTGNFGAHVNNLQAQFWSPPSNWCCCESNPVNYCTSGISSAGCQARISASGTSSATATSGFFLRAANVEGSDTGTSGIFFYGVNGRQANPWGNPAMMCTSYQCVRPPTRRGGLLNGGGSNDTCDATFVQDLNARWTAKPAHNPGAGATVQGQLWYRDPDNPCKGAMAQSTTALSNAVEWFVCP